ncbi:MAG: tetratricopeptide repeat protein [Acidobacteriota bacterium]
MRSLSTKAARSRASAVQKGRTTKAKKAAPKTRPAKVALVKSASKQKKSAASPKKAVAVKKKAAPAKMPVKASKVVKKTAAKKPAARKSLVRKPVAGKTPARRLAASKPARKPVVRKPVRAKAAARVVQPAKPAPPPPRKPPASEAAVKAFEHALKVFNRHDFAAAKTAFEGLLEKFGDQLEVIAGARTYLTICEQRLARAPSVPRSPDALYNQGVFELNKGNIKEAISLFDKALRGAPQADHIFYSLAAAHARMNNATKAMEALRRAIALHPLHRSHARSDLDFAFLRDNEAFRELTGYGYDLFEE